MHIAPHILLLVFLVVPAMCIYASVAKVSSESAGDPTRGNLRVFGALPCYLLCRRVDAYATMSGTPTTAVKKNIYMERETRSHFGSKLKHVLLKSFLVDTLIVSMSVSEALVLADPVVDAGAVEDDDLIVVVANANPAAA